MCLVPNSDEVQNSQERWLRECSLLVDYSSCTIVYLFYVFSIQFQILKENY